MPVYPGALKSPYHSQPSEWRICLSYAKNPIATYVPISDLCTVSARTFLRRESGSRRLMDCEDGPILTSSIDTVGLLTLCSPGALGLSPYVIAESLQGGPCLRTVVPRPCADQRNRKR